MTDEERKKLLDERETLAARMKEISSELVCGATIHLNDYTAMCKLEGRHEGAHVAEYLWAPRRPGDGDQQPWIACWYDTPSSNLVEENKRLRVAIEDRAAKIPSNLAEFHVALDAWNALTEDQREEFYRGQFFASASIDALRLLRASVR